MKLSFVEGLAQIDTSECHIKQQDKRWYLARAGKTSTLTDDPKEGIKPNLELAFKWQTNSSKLEIL